MRIVGPLSIGLAALVVGSAGTCADPAGPPPSGSALYQDTPLITGDVSLAFGYAEGSGAADFEGAVLVGSGVVNLPLWAGWNEDVEVAEIIGDSRTDYGVFGHTYFKTPEYAAGFVLGGTKTNGSGYDGSAVTAGLEAAAFFPTATLIAQVLYSWGGGDTSDTWSLGGEARWYLDPDSKLSGRVAYRGDSSDVILGAAAEHRFTGSMFSLFAAASYCTCATWDVILGTRLILAPTQRSLQDHDHTVPFAIGRPVSG